MAALTPPEQPRAMTTSLQRVAFGAFLVVAASYAAVRLRGPNGIPALFEKRELIQMLQQRNGQLREENRNDRRFNEELRTNEDTQRRVILQLQGKLPADAVIFWVDEPPDDEAAAGAASSTSPK